MVDDGVVGKGEEISNVYIRPFWEVQNLAV